MDKYTFLNKILGRINRYGDQVYELFSNYLYHQVSHNKAHKWRKFYEKNNTKRLDRNTKIKIKEYCDEYFGSSSYWPWIALYTVIRGEFKKGCIPYDFYRFQLIPKWSTGPRLSAFKTYYYKLFPEFSVKPYFTKISGTFFDSELKRVDDSEVNDFLKNFDREVVEKYKIYSLFNI